VRSKSSLDSSSKPGSKHKIIAFKAGRKAEGSRVTRYDSIRDRKTGLTDKEAKDSVEDKPERYRAKSRDRASV